MKKNFILLCVLFLTLAAQLHAARKEDDIIKNKALNLEKALSGHIYEQEEAIRETANALIRYAAGINDPNLPIANLLYCGPSGVGKTELALQVCYHLYGDMSHFIRINMSEYIDEYSLSSLIGSPPGYIGYEKGGQLSNAILAKPYSVVLLDEIEKAHPKILKLFLHVFDAGYFKSAAGQIIDCRKCLFILTSNLGSLEIAELCKQNYTKKEALEIIKPLFFEVLSPELYNRLDPIVFFPLSKQCIDKLVHKMLSLVGSRVLKSKGITLIFDDSLIDYFASIGTDPKLGARPLKRTIEKEFTTEVAKVLMRNNYKKNDKIRCSYREDSLIFEKI